MIDIMSILKFRNTFYKQAKST